MCLTLVQAHWNSLSTSQYIFIKKYFLQKKTYNDNKLYHLVFRKSPVEAISKKFKAWMWSCSFFFFHLLHIWQTYSVKLKNIMRMLLVMNVVHRAIMVRSYGYSHWETVGSKSRGDQILARCRQWSNLVTSEFIGIYISLNIFQALDVK